MSEPWWKTAVFYQIYPRSFRDSNADGVGDLPGIISKLDYFVELGIDALWVSPFFKSPMDDFGYDISDYRDVDPVFGSLDDARKLIAEAHKRKLKIVFDLVINHTSDQHPWFIEARSAKDNPKHDWYIWKPRRDAKTGKKLRKPNNWVCQFEFSSAWWSNEATDEWYLGTFTRHQPEVNMRNPELRKAMYDVVRFWLDEGIDGFRMDVVNWYVKDVQFRSNPFSWNANPDIFQQHIFDRNQPEIHDICREIRAIADTYPGERVLIGEIFTREAKIAASYQGNGTDELHLSFNMEMLYIDWDAKAIGRAIRNWYEALPENGWPNFTLSNHDQPRHGERFRIGDDTKNDAKGKLQFARLQIASMLLLTVRGTPFVYYGEEIGMPNTNIPRRELVDPTGITFWPLPLGRDGERTPMQWNDADGAGFTSGEARPWLRINADFRNRNVSIQQRAPMSIWHWYRTLIEIRKKFNALQTGDFRFLHDGSEEIIAYRRTPAGASSSEGKPASTAPTAGSIDCFLNLSMKPKTIFLDADARIILGNRRGAQEFAAKGELVLAPHEALLVSF